jgi:tetratricopeptide (TPR) repeat protein
MEELSGVPKSTIVKWFEGTTASPRDWRRLLKLAVALELDHGEVDALLASANHQPINELRRKATRPGDRDLLAPWPPLDPPFRAENTLDYFTDRTAPLAALTAMLTEPQPPRLVSIEGMVGVGKTELAARLAHALRSHFSDGVLWVDAENLDPLSKLGELAADLQFDLSRYREVADRSRAFKELLGKKKVLLILDGVTRDDQVEPFVPPANSPSVVIVTTRHQDLWATRTAYAITIEDFADVDALQLYDTILGADRVAAESDALLGLANSVGNLPIALDITAHLLKKHPDWTVADFQDRTASAEGRVDQLRMGTDQNVSRLFETSYQQLSRPQQAVFATLGMFASSGFSTAAVAVVSDLPEPAAEDLLQSLVEISLLKETAPKRYRLHLLVRDFARLKEPVAGAEERLVQFYVDYVQAHRYSFAAITPEIDNIRVAIDLAQQRGWDGRFINAANWLHPYLVANGLLGETKARLTAALAAARRLSDATAEALTLLHLAELERIAGNLDATMTLLETALPLVDEGLDVEAFCGVHQGMGVVRAFQRDFSGAETAWQQALRVARNNQYHRGTSALLHNLSSVKLYQRNLDEVAVMLAEGLELARSIEAWDLEAKILSNLASLEAGLGNMTAANDYLKQGLELARRSGQRETIIGTSANLAATDIELGDYQSAAAHLLEALLQAREQGDVEGLSRVLRNYGELYSETGNFVAADDHFGQALDYARSARNEILTLTTLADWGAQLTARGDYARAETLLSEVMATADADDFPEFIAIAAYGLARFYASQGATDEACLRSREALALFEEIGDPRREEVAGFMAQLPCDDSHVSRLS